MYTRYSRKMLDELVKFIFPISLLILLFHNNYAFSKNLIKACGHHDYAPWNWLQDGKIVGVCAEIASDLYAKLGYELDLRYVGPWARCQKLIAEGKVDVNICSLKNETRQKYSVFSNVPIAHNEQAIFVRTKDSFEFSQLEDLKGKSIGIVRGVSLGNEIDEYLKKHTRLVLVADYSSLFNMLQINRIDGLIVARESGKSYVQLNSLVDEIVDLPTALVLADLYISISKKSKFVDTLPLLQQVLESKDYRAWYQALFAKYNIEFTQAVESEQQIVYPKSELSFNESSFRTIQVDLLKVEKD
jgi:polar amino acid transport system substrate-binding protein